MASSVSTRVKYSEDTLLLALPVRFASSRHAVEGFTHVRHLTSFLSIMPGRIFSYGSVPHIGRLRWPPVDLGLEIGAGLPEDQVTLRGTTDLSVAPSGTFACHHWWMGRHHPLFGLVEVVCFVLRSCIYFLLDLHTSSFPLPRLVSNLLRIERRQLVARNHLTVNSFPINGD